MCVSIKIFKIILRIGERREKKEENERNAEEGEREVEQERE